MKVKHVNFKYELVGQGIVNFDSNEQKFIWNRESKKGNKNKFTTTNNNVLYAKKHYFRNDKGELDYKIKISSDALRNSIFRGDAIATNPTIAHHKGILNSFIGCPLGLIRGYMFAGKNETFKRKSPLTITSAIQSNNSESFIEFHSRSGQKTSKSENDVKNNTKEDSDTTIFSKESIGEITYTGQGFINIQDLSFISADTVFDRYSFNPDDYEILEKVLNNNLPNFNSQLGNYKLKTSSVDIPEYGLQLSDENVVYLIKETLKRILNIQITRNNGYAKTSKLEIELVYDPIDKSKNKIIEINNLNDIDKLDFEPEQYYNLIENNE